MLRDEDIRIDIGRCAGGSFLRVVHLPTGISRPKSPLGGEPGARVRARLLAEIGRELVRRGLTGPVARVPDAPAGRGDA